MENIFNIKKILFILLWACVGTLAGLSFGNLGESCGTNNDGEVTLKEDCSTGVMITNMMEANDDWKRTDNKVCCIKDYYQQHKRSVRKSEEACRKFGVGIKRQIFPSHYAQPGEYQHNVALGYEGGPNNDEIVWGKCSGVLISKDFVLTVANCIVNPGGETPVMARVGNVDLSGEEDTVKPQDIPIAEITVHPGLNVVMKTNNIALLRLTEPAEFTDYVQPACLYTKTDTPDNMVSTGWGAVNLGDSSYSDILLKSNFRTVDTASCNKSYTTRGISESHLCGLTDTSLCYLGSGSSVFVENDDNRVSVVGLSSYGKGCGSSVPSVYTRVSSYLSWIEEIVWA